MAAAAEIEEFKNFIRGREVNAETTVEDYARWVERFEYWFDADEPTEADARRFDSYLFETAEFPWGFTRPLKDESYAYQTRIKAASALKHWFKYRYDYRIGTEVQNMVLGEEGEFDPDVLSENDVENVILNADPVCKCDGCRACMILGYDAIMRAAELADARVDDVDLDAGTIWVRAKKGSISKSLPLDDRTVGALAEHIDRVGDKEYLFYNSYGRPWGAKENGNKYLAKHFWRKHHEVGIHSFTRHSPICHRLTSGESLGDVYQRARHVNISTTMRYARYVGVDIPDWAQDEAAR